ncbi:uncharacterized protein LOC123715193 [Pieris brassicae]|uniref:uncharacterized protein LOC123715193 n=1 Tax=Pieris brassicae TaxID=7116 RepID=UPI001E65F804|nr:uncharacterized protein LOC123715193 [Pieris brassicae]
MEKINSKRINEPKAKVTDQGDILKLEDKSLNSRLTNGLYLADRGDSKKILLKSRTNADIRTNRCEIKLRNTKLNVDNDNIKHSTPDRNALGNKTSVKTNEIKSKTEETLSKPINVRSRVKTYIQNLKMYSDHKSKDNNLSNVSNINNKLERPKANGGKVLHSNEIPNLVQHDVLKHTLDKMNLGYLVSNEYTRCNKEVNNGALLQKPRPQPIQDEFVDSAIESQINEVLKCKQNKEGVDECSKRNTKLLDANERKKIKEKHFIKSKVSSNIKEVSQIDSPESKQKQSKEILDNKSVSIKTKDSLKKSESSRRPVITTIRSKHDTKVYKAVTFTDLKHREIRPIEIKIPIVKRKEKVKSCDKNTNVSNSSKEKKKRFRKKRSFLSPVLVKKGESPPTEVAKWAPSCVNKLAIPYYEAWIDTTLAAISKSSKKDKVLEKQKLIKSFKKFLERPQTPDLIYDHMDERYTGKIKIKQRHKE